MLLILGYGVFLWGGVWDMGYAIGYFYRVWGMG